MNQPPKNPRKFRERKSFAAEHIHRFTERFIDRDVALERIKWEVAHSVVAKMFDEGINFFQIRLTTEQDEALRDQFILQPDEETPMRIRVTGIEDFES